MKDVNYASVVNGIIEAFREDGKIATGDISDTHHTFDELYSHRTKLFAWGCNMNKENAWKSKLHYEGDMFDGMFIAGVTTPDGNYTYHCEMEFWDIFKVKELERGLEWDGHSAADIDRIFSIEASDPSKGFGYEDRCFAAKSTMAALDKFLDNAWGVQLVDYLLSKGLRSDNIMATETLDDVDEYEYSKLLQRLENGMLIKFEVWPNDDGETFWGRATEIIE